MMCGGGVWVPDYIFLGPPGLLAISNDRDISLCAFSSRTPSSGLKIDPVFCRCIMVSGVRTRSVFVGSQMCSIIYYAGKKW